MKEDNLELIRTFYEAFRKLDAEEMAMCYHDQVVFEDPAFGQLKAEHAKNMWRMLCDSQKGKDFQVEYSNIQVSESGATASWEAKYTFSKTGRRVHNRIRAEFEIIDGKIIKHKDDFDLRKWAAQAMGFKGSLLGGTNFFRKKLQSQTNSLLSRFESKM